MGLGEICERCPMAEGWNIMNFKIPFNPHHSVFSDMELGGAVCVSDDGR